jgi:phosphatidylethanolamine-binding protein (PEBP) family uncharacterized protein
MSRSWISIQLVATFAALALAGCGGSSNGNSTSSAEGVRQVTIGFGSPPIRGGGEIPRVYTCDGRNVSPPLTWAVVPRGIEELAVFVVGLRHTTIEWAMAGVRPSLHRIGTGRVPPGAYVLRSTSGKAAYSVCPAKREDYAFVLLALPPHVHSVPKITGANLLADLVESSPRDRTPALGSFDVSYTRR